MDLSRSVCVTPGKRGGRVILESLLRECEAEGLHLHPPQFITPGVLPEVLCRHDDPQPIATIDECHMAWIRAVQECDDQTLNPLMANVPARDDLLAWHALAHLIQNLHEQLAGGMLTFEDVADKAARLELFGETDRWHALGAIHNAYLEVLTRAGLSDPHHARLDALDKARGLPSMGTHQNEIILIGIAELNILQRKALTRAQNITALIHAPQSMSEAFDDLGCVIPSQWTDRTIEIEDEKIIVADLPDDQSQAALHRIAQSRGAPVDSITIGLGDESLGESLERAADWAGLAIHRAESRTLAHTGPYRLLDAIGQWISEQRFAAFAALLRHPDIERWLRPSPDGTAESSAAIHDWITLLDKYFTDHLHTRLTSPWLGNPDRRKKLKTVHDAVSELASPLLTDPKQRALSEWSEPILEILNRIYIDAPTQTSELRTQNSQSIDACIAIRDQLAAFASIDASLQPKCDAPTALNLLLTSCANISLPTPLRNDQIEALGWLELHLDAAPTLILMGVNDGSIPAAISADAFMPDSLRAVLGLQCNASRYARDAYLLEAMARSRANLTLITGRRGADGEPLAPSRLLLACNRRQLPARVMRLSDESSALRRPIPIGAPKHAPLCNFKVFQPPPGPVVLERMRVTAFRDYLRCPFRWYLRHIARIDAIGDEAEELDPLGFGILAHDVLEAFARDEEVRECADAEQLSETLRNTLAGLATDRFGNRPPPALRIQLDRLTRRLESFAHFQAQHRADGWRIIATELKLEDCTLDIPGQGPITVTGKIDRIDVHEESGSLRISDYKTGDKGETPFEAHHGRRTYREDSWIDLQLPLYKHLAAQCGYGGEDAVVELGYIVLPKDSSMVDFLAAKWTSEQLDEAIEKARWVVMQIRAGNFPMGEGGVFSDDFENICQTNVLGRVDDVEVEA